MKQLLSIISVIFVTVLLLVQPAKAAVVEVNNNTDEILHLAIVWHFDEDGNWYSQGWWNVEANSLRTLNFPNHKKGEIWVHGYTASTTYGEDRGFWVHDEAFLYPTKGTLTKGTKDRLAGFSRYELTEDGEVKIDFNPIKNFDVVIEPELVIAAKS